MTSLDQKQQTLRNFIRYIGTEAENGFYRSFWNSCGAAQYDTSVPPIDVSPFIETPLRDRKYKHEPGIVKVVNRNGAYFLIKYTRRDIRNETYGIASKRPFVFLSDRAETLEKAWWFYEHNILPAAGEHNNLPASGYLANWFDADQLVTDMRTLRSLLPMIEKTSSTLKIDMLTVFDSHFEADENIFPLFERFRSIRLILGLPETGVIAHACPEAFKRKDILFHPDRHALVEPDGLLVVSKLSLLTTPIIRYRTDILAERDLDHTCACEHDGIAFRLK